VIKLIVIAARGYGGSAFEGWQFSESSVGL
jgi:hypothetical protein